MADGECKDTRFRHIAGMVANETAARLSGGQVDNGPIRRKPSFGNILTLLTMAAFVLGFAWNAGSETTKVKSDVAVVALSVKAVEARQTEDRTELNGRIKEIRDDMGQVRSDMQKVLSAVERMNGRQDAERERRGR